jgi:CRP/FNR family nitrogen fixation transcriptional regulator
MSLHAAAYSNPFKSAEPIALAWSSRCEAGERSTSLLHISQDREIYSEGDKALGYFKIVSGVVRTCKFLSDGRRQIDAFYKAGDIFGYEWNGEHYLTAEAVSDCMIMPYRLSTTDLLPSAQLFSHAMQNLARAREHSRLLQRRSAMEKLVVFLMEYAEHPIEDEVIVLAMTRQDIADYLGLTIETVSRTFSHLERDAMISLPATRQIRLKNLQALQALIA